MITFLELHFKYHSKKCSSCNSIFSKGWRCNSIQGCFVTNLLFAKQKFETLWQHLSLLNAFWRKNLTLRYTKASLFKFCYRQKKFNPYQNIVFVYLNRNICWQQRWSPRGRSWPRGRPRGHILKSLALASRPQVLENWPVLGSRTAVFFELLKFCEALENFFVRSLEKFLWRPFSFFFGEHLRLCPWSLALASNIPVLGLESVCPRKGCPWPWIFFVSLALASSLMSSTPPLVDNCQHAVSMVFFNANAWSFQIYCSCVMEMRYWSQFIDCTFNLSLKNIAIFNLKSRVSFLINI